jgi:hypothetical protein
MRFQLGNASGMDDRDLEAGWTLVEKPPIGRWQLMAFPVAILNIGVVALLWVVLTPAGGQLGSIPLPVPILGFVTCLVGVLLVHESFHTMGHPKMGCSQQSIIGFWPSRMLLYAIYVGTVSRKRFIIILLMPLAAISVAPLVISIATYYYSFWLAYVTIMNAFVASGDVLEVVTILRQVPPDAEIKRIGWDYCWKRGPAQMM